DSMRRTIIRSPIGLSFTMISPARTHEQKTIPPCPLQVSCLASGVGLNDGLCYSYVSVSLLTIVLGLPSWHNDTIRLSDWQTTSKSRSHPKPGTFGLSGFRLLEQSSRVLYDDVSKCSWTTVCR